MREQYSAVNAGRRSCGHGRGRKLPGVIVPAAIVLSLAQPAHAYLDPGTGSIIVQGIVAGVAATVAYAGMYWQRVKAFFTGRSRSEETDSPDAAPKPGDPSP